MSVISKEKYLESLFTILKGRLPKTSEIQFWEERYNLSVTTETTAIESITGTAVDNTDPLNPIINTIGVGGGSDVTLAQFTQLSNEVSNHISNQNNPHITQSASIPDGLDLVTIFNTGLV